MSINSNISSSLVTGMGSPGTPTRILKVFWLHLRLGYIIAGFWENFDTDTTTTSVLQELLLSFVAKQGSSAQIIPMDSCLPS